MTNISALLFAATMIHAAEPRMLDTFESVAAWNVQHTDDVVASIASAPGHDGKSLRLDFDFNHVNGYATVHRDLPLDLPDNYELSFWIRGEAPVNTLQFKLIDASGSNVWWMNRPDYEFSRKWKRITLKKRQIEFAWGPTQDHELKHSASIEFVISSGRDGGKGSVYFDDLTLRELPLTTKQHPVPIATASSSLAGSPQIIFDASSDAMWCSDPKSGNEQHFDIDLRETREFGGIVIDWWKKPAIDYDILFSDDAKNWRLVRSVRNGDGGTDPIDLPESETRYMRIAMHRGNGDGYCITNISIKDLSWGASPNAFFLALAKDAERGDYPRGFVEQTYWTLVGIDGGPTPALMSEDGALQPSLSGPSIEPFLIVGGKLVSWADVQPTQSLRDGYLPIPSVMWKSGQLQLSVEAFAGGTYLVSQIFARYRLENQSDRLQSVDLVLAIRPFQVNPPTQFLNVAGGFSAIHDLKWKDGTVIVDGAPEISPIQTPTRFVASTFDAGPLPRRLLTSTTLPSDAHDDRGYSSGALVYHFDLPAKSGREVDLMSPLSGAAQKPPTDSNEIAREADRVASQWHSKLDKVGLSLPPQAKRIAGTLRTALAHILITRDGAALRPGTRSYARSWIRDGTMMADALLRLGQIDAVREYVEWYAPHQFANGKVPCCVDRRGSDPVPENDSHGELIHLIAQRYRYRGDTTELERLWPHVASAVAYMDQLSASETGADNPAFKGLMPASISHEGYSSKPMHSYWDDFWALTGYKDAVDIAHALKRGDDATRIAASRDRFGQDLHRSLELATASHSVDYLPGCVELGDFDATSTTIALSPANAQADLPQDKLRTTFDRYWNGFVERRDGIKPWEDYTPYEWRVVGAFTRLNQRDRASAASDFFFDTGARPIAWNQWAEVVGRDPRKQRFIGDMPHGWVASDFIRSTLDRLVYERGDSLVLAAGVPASWFADNGIVIDHLRTPYGEVSYRIRRTRQGFAIHVDAQRAPPGGFVFAWPDEKPPIIAGGNKDVMWKGGELYFHAAQADFLIRE